MLNLVHFIHGLTMGGAETLVKEYALGIDKRKFNLTVLCVDRVHSSYEDLLAEHHIPVIYVNDHVVFRSKNAWWVQILNCIQYYYFTRKFLRQLRPDILHIHLQLGHFVKFARLPKSTKIFYTQHSDVNRYKNENPRQIWVLRWLVRHYPTQLIALNSHMQKQLNQLFGVSNTVVLNNGINVSRFQHAKSKTQIRQELGISQDAFVLGHVGRFHPVKNHSFLIDLVAKIRMYNPRTWLLLVGDGPNRAELEQKINACGLKEQVLMVSNRTDVPDLLAAMDRFVFPSLSEGVPLALIEAQVAGLPCVVSDRVPPAAKISNLVTFKSLKEPLESWIESILQPPPAPQYTHLEEWDISAIIRQLEKLYER